MAKYPIKIVENNGQQFVLDAIRKKYIVLTPEEMIRQQTIQFLIEKCNYPKGCISVEKKIKIGSIQLRYDIVIYKDIHPWMLIECKAPEIILDKQILKQSLVYQFTIQAKYILLTNGIQTICMDITNKIWMKEMPIWGSE